MAKLQKLPNAQWPITAVFEFQATDTMVNIAGDEVAFGAEGASLTTYDILTPPPGAFVIGGLVKNVAIFSGATASTADVGDSDDPNRYTETAPHNLADADAPATAFDMLGDHKVYNGSQAIRLTILNTVTPATAGKAAVVVTMVVPGRASENLKTT